MRRKLQALAAALAMALVAMLVSSAPASAAIAGSDHVYLLNSGATTLSATTDWRFYVEVPSSLALDQEYWNFTCYGEMVNNSGAAVGATYTVTIYLSDGTINRSASSSITVANTSYGKVYGNISFNAAAIGLFETNSSASMYVKLVQSTTKDSWAGTVGIYSDGTSGAVGAWIPALISLALMALILPFIFGMTDSIAKGFKGFGGSGSRRGKKK